MAGHTVSYINQINVVNVTISTQSSQCEDVKLDLLAKIYKKKGSSEHNADSRRWWLIKVMWELLFKGRKVTWCEGLFLPTLSIAMQCIGIDQGACELWDILQMLNIIHNVHIYCSLFLCESILFTVEWLSMIGVESGL